MDISFLMQFKMQNTALNIIFIVPLYAGLRQKSTLTSNKSAVASLFRTTHFFVI